jgi:UDP-N-acetyl-2-amino-2-deoxyglucuronate dehydrogenase
LLQWTNLILWESWTAFFLMQVSLWSLSGSTGIWKSFIAAASPLTIFLFVHPIICTTPICEKPLALNPWNVEALGQVQKETGRDVYNILQLRLHPDIIALKEKVQSSDPSKIFDLDLTYITSRGNWYYASWKGDVQKSGGVATNIGIHFFDMLIWIFGGVKENIVHVHTHDRAAGFLHLERARVRWFLSINEDTLSEEVKAKGQRTFRSITLEGNKIEFSEGFTDLHTKSYQRILDGNGFTLMEALPSIELAHAIRTQKPVGHKGEYHPFATKPLATHPFSGKHALNFVQS